MTTNKLKNLSNHLSFVDKFTENNSSQFTDTSIKLSKITEKIGQDLEKLLNTRNSLIERVKHLIEVNQSILNYGISDFSNKFSTTDNQQKLFCRELTAIIRLFEPRIKNIAVSLLEQDKTLMPILRIKIEGSITYDQESHIVSFESRIKPQNQTFNII